MASERYDFVSIEKRWQARWLADKLFERAQDPSAAYYCLMMYPYPSGALHMGHVINYTLGDALVRYHVSESDGFAFAGTSIRPCRTHAAEAVMVIRSEAPSAQPVEKFRGAI